MMASEDSFINKYRPSTFDEVFGHTEVIHTLTQTMYPPDRPHAYLITGPSGIGKTSIARLIGNFLGAEIVEIDAASHSGVDDMREIVELSQYKSLQGDGNRLYIIDECQMLSRQAWQALLKLAEEPPDHFFIALCTTEPDKVPATIRGQRAYQVILRPLGTATMESYVEAICVAENWTDISGDAFNAVIRGAEGSPRKALILLLAVHDAVSQEDIKARINSFGEASIPLVQICQLLMRGKPSWDDVMPILGSMGDGEFDGAIEHACRYFAACMTGHGRNNKIAILANEYLQAFTFPSSSPDKKVQFIAALGRCVFR